MPAINFPPNPSVNATHTHNGKNWKWNGVHWSANTESEGSIQSSWHTLGSTQYSSSTSPQYDYKYYRITDWITYDLNRVYEIIIDADDNAGHVAIYHLYISQHVNTGNHDRIIMSHVSGKPTMMRVVLDSNEHVWIAATQKWGTIKIRGLHENEDVTSMPFADSQLASIPSPQFNETAQFIWDGDTNTLALMPTTNLTGMLGIGTATPDTLLQVSGDATSVGVAISFEDTNASGKTYGIRSDLGEFIIRDFDASTDRMIIDSDGSVNIGNFRIEQDGVGSYLEGVTSISFRDTTNSWTYAPNHGIMSTDHNGNLSDDISINSYHHISLRLDTNNNQSDGYVRIMKNNAVGNNVSHYFGSNTTGLNVSYMSGNVGINTSPKTDSYRLSMGGHIHMNNFAINYVDQLHFNDNVRFIDEGNDNYLRFKWGNAGEGGIKFVDGDDNVNGAVYGSNNGFGLVSQSWDWAVRIYPNGETQLYYDGYEKLNTKSTGVDITGNLEVRTDSANTATLSGTSGLDDVVIRGSENVGLMIVSKATSLTSSSSAATINFACDVSAGSVIVGTQDTQHGFIKTVIDTASEDTSMHLGLKGNEYLSILDGGNVKVNGNIYLESTSNPTIFFNGSSDAGIDMAIKATPEGLDFYEPEDGNKLHFQILDDTGVNSVYGYKWNGQSLDDRYLVSSGGEIPAGVDLNTYRTTGFYSQNTNTDTTATGSANWPTPYAGILQVINDDYGNGVHTVQIYYQYNSTYVYQRYYYNGSWTGWTNLNNNAIPKATTSDFGLVKLGTGAVQTTNPNTPTTTASRTYAVQMLSNDQLVVNVPWTDSGSSTPSVSTIYFNNETTTSGAPPVDGAVFRYENNFFGSSLDALVIEKTDSNGSDPDGGIAFTNRGVDSNGQAVTSTSMVIRGTGDIGIGTKTPETSLHVDGGSILVNAFDNANTGIFFRQKYTPTHSTSYVTDNQYNLSIIAYDHNSSGHRDGLSINGYDGVSFCTGNSTTRQQRMLIDSAGAVRVNTELYNDGWFRNTGAGEGLYHQNNGNHFYSRDSKFWHITSKSDQTQGGLGFFKGHNDGITISNRKGFVFWDGTGFGLVDNDGSWAFRTVNNEAQLFYDGAEKLNTKSTGVDVTGNLDVSGSITEGGTALSSKYAAIGSTGSSTGTPTNVTPSDMATGTDKNILMISGTYQINATHNTTMSSGTFTPSYGTSGTGFSNMTFNPARYGTYSRTGRTIYFNLYIYSWQYTAGSETGYLKITGLPFTSHSTHSIGRGQITIGYHREWVNAPKTGYVMEGTSEIRLWR